MKRQLLLGYDLGSSSVKASLIDANSGELVESAFSPAIEMEINSPRKGWAEQDPNIWWKNLVLATKSVMNKANKNAAEIIAIGLAYQMHGLVMVDKDQNVLYPSIIWCDSRAVDIGQNAFQDLGEEFCLRNYLNSPGNFTASKLKWMKENEPEVYKRIYKIMLPGDFIAMRLTGEINTTITGLSEGILWNFEKYDIANKLLEYYEIDKDFIPEALPTFHVHGYLSEAAANELGLEKGIKVSYRAGDQPNNAFSLNVLNPGEIAATAGTSGVVYGITESNNYDKQSRINSFAHVNYSPEQRYKGVLLCINGTGILYSWIRNKVMSNQITYEEMNRLADSVEIGSEGVITMPYGNGAERSLGNRDINSHIIGLNFNAHNNTHLIRSALEGIVFAFNYGIEIMKEVGLELNVIRAGNANLFLSEVFCEALSNTSGAVIEKYNTDGSQGAARGAGVGSGFYKNFEDTFGGLNIVKSVPPIESKQKQYQENYQNWKAHLERLLN